MAILTTRNFAFPNFTPGRYPIPPDFRLLPDIAALDPSVRSVPEGVTIPPTVRTGDVITAAHENMVTEALADLWTDVQYLDGAKLSDPTSAKGDLITRTGGAVARLPVGADSQVLAADSSLATGLKWASLTAVGAVPATRQVIAGAGLAGGGALSADVTLTANVRTVFGRTGDVVLTTADISGAGGVPATRQILAGAGLTGGGNLSADRTLAVNIGAVQTPWVSDIDGALHNLNNVGNIRMSGTRGTLFVHGDSAGHVGGLQFATLGAGQPIVITPTDNAGTPVAVPISLGGFGAFNSLAVTLGVSGSLGIGTIGPVAPLHIFAAAPKVILERTTGGLQHAIYTDGNNHLITDVPTGAGEWILSIGGDSKLRLRQDTTFITPVPTIDTGVGGISNNRMYVWFDESNSRLVFQTKTSGGVAKKATLTVA